MDNADVTLTGENTLRAYWMRGDPREVSITVTVNLPSDYNEVVCGYVGDIPVCLSPEDIEALKAMKAEGEKQMQRDDITGDTLQVVSDYVNSIDLLLQLENNPGARITGKATKVLTVLQAMHETAETGGGWGDVIGRTTSSFFNLGEVWLLSDILAAGWEYLYVPTRTWISGPMDTWERVGILQPIGFMEAGVEATGENLSANYYRNWQVGPYKNPLIGNISGIIVKLDYVYMGPGDYFTVYTSNMVPIWESTPEVRHEDVPVGIPDETGRVIVDCDDSGADSYGFKFDPEGFIFLKCHYARYYNQDDNATKLVKRGIEAVPIDFSWGSSSPYPEVDNDYFTVVWSGQINIPANDTYTFYVKSGNGTVNLRIDNNTLFSNCIFDDLAEASNSTYLQEGWHDFAIYYHHTTGDASFKLSWANTTMSKQVVPDDNMRTGETELASLPLTAFFSYEVPESGTNVSFTDMSFGDNITEWEWDYGDGTVETYDRSVNPFHEYSETGFYNVSLTVTNSTGGTSTYSEVIDVHANPPPVANFTQFFKAIDQPESNVAVTSVYEAWQTFKAVSSSIYRVDFYTWQAGWEVWATIEDMNGTILGTSGRTQSKDGYYSDGTVHFDFLEPVEVTPGKTYKMVMHDDDPYWGPGTVYSENDPYPDGRCTWGASYDLYFAVYGWGYTNPKPNDLITFNASASYDPDGTIISYNWEFGDGNTSSGEIVTHQYTAAGTYMVNLTVTDDDGATDIVSKFIKINSPPVASFTYTVSQPDIEVSISQSEGAGDTVFAHLEGAWQSFKPVSDTITAVDIATYRGGYDVWITIEDMDGNIVATSNHNTSKTCDAVRCSWTHLDLPFPVRVTPGLTYKIKEHCPPPRSGYDAGVSASSSNPYPDGIFHQYGTDHTSHDMMFQIYSYEYPYMVEFTDTSTDIDGNITEWYWDFGDGTNSTEQNPVHNYTVIGTYTVTLIVTDDKGATYSITKNISVGPLFASFTYSPSLPTTADVITFNANASHGGNGTIVKYEWDWTSDGIIDDTGVIAYHQFTTEGTYTVTLTVTNDRGEKATASCNITVNIPLGEAVDNTELSWITGGDSEYGKLVWAVRDLLL